jgi:hypothetical protein
MNYYFIDATLGACPSGCSAVSRGSNLSELPPLSHLDLDVIRNLPPEIFSEMNESYKGELCKILETRQLDKCTSESVEKNVSLLIEYWSSVLVQINTVAQLLCCRWITFSIK